MKRYHGCKALPRDKVKAFMIQTAAKVTSPALVKLVNITITEAKFPGRWKFHVVVSHHKKVDKLSVGNYRPLCHLLEIGKLVELVVWYQLSLCQTRADPPTPSWFHATP